MADVRINPSTQINFQAHLNPVQEHRPLLSDRRCVQGWHEYTIDEVVQDLHVLLEVLGGKVGVLIPHYLP